MGRIEGYGFRRKAAITLLSVALGYSSQFEGTGILPAFCQRFLNPHNVCYTLFSQPFYTTRLTYDHSHISPWFYFPSSASPPANLGHTYLKESLQPPDLKYALPNQNSQLKYAPPLDPTICAFGRIAVGAFADDDVGLFIFDLV